MIKFFRKIRQRLLTENKFSKYLLYAVGEIALVVIGILIALQVNNWNEKRKENIAEKALVISFIEMVESDNDAFKTLQKGIEKINSLHTNLYLIGVENKEIVDIGDPRFVRVIPNTGILSIDNFPNISSQISNETIINSINKYYNELKFYRVLQQEIRKIVEDEIRPFLGTENIYDLKEWYFNQNNTGGNANFVSKDKLIVLSKKPSFQQLLLQANTKFKSMKRTSDRLIEKNKHLNETLKTELSNY